MNRTFNLLTACLILGSGFTFSTESFAQKLNNENESVSPESVTSDSYKNSEVGVLENTTSLSTESNGQIKNILVPTEKKNSPQTALSNQSSTHKAKTNTDSKSLIKDSFIDIQDTKKEEFILSQKSTENRIIQSNLDDKFKTINKLQETEIITSLNQINSSLSHFSLENVNNKNTSIDFDYIQSIEHVQETPAYYISTDSGDYSIPYSPRRRTKFDSEAISNKDISLSVPAFEEMTNIKSSKNSESLIFSQNPTNSISLENNSNENKTQSNKKKLPSRVQLFYFRNSCEVQRLLKAAIPELKTVAPPTCLELSVMGDEGSTNESSANENNAAKDDKSNEHINANLGSDELIIIGTTDDKKEAMRLIAALDLPRPGIELQMWGVNISSDDPDDLAKVMGKVRQEIDNTQQLVRETFKFIKKEVLEINEDNFESNFKDIIEKAGYQDALSPSQDISLTDIILRLVAAEHKKNPNNPTLSLANKLELFMRGDPRKRFNDYLSSLQKSNQVPFERFLTARGLTLNCTDELCKWKEDDFGADRFAHISRTSILRFGLHYASFIHNSEHFDPYLLQLSSGELNDALRDTKKALHQDIESLFLYPTLRKIQRIVKKFGDVEYSEAGRTTLAGLSGLPMTSNTTTVSAFNYTQPLSIKDILTEANSTTSGLESFASLSSGVPIDKIVGSLIALEKDRTIWRQATAQNNFTLTPHVLRNMTSAQLNIDITKSDPLAAQGQEGKTVKGEVLPLEPISRITSQRVVTTIDADAVDFFAFSTFSNQNSVDAGRGYIPLIGPVWRGLFGEIPIFGKLFSWKKKPKSVLHESLLLTNSFITPTPMGIALLEPIDNDGTIPGDLDIEGCEFKKPKDINGIEIENIKGIHDPNSIEQCIRNYRKLLK